MSVSGSGDAGRPTPSSDSDSDDSGALEALGRKFAKEWDPYGLVTHKVSTLTVEQQLAYKSTNEAVKDIEKDYESLEHEDAQQLIKAEGDRVVRALKSTYEITRQETNNVLLVKPGRRTIISGLSGSLFSAGTKIGIERLLDEENYLKDFEMIMRDQLMKDIETIDVNSLLCNCAKFPLKEDHCLAKYLLFTMSVCKRERIVDTIYDALLDFRVWWNLELTDYLDVLNNWGIPKKLLYPPYTEPFIEDTCDTDSSPGCNFEVAEYNIFKFLDYVCEMFDGHLRSDLEHRMTFVRVLMLLWLDKRFTPLWNCYKFGSVITRLLEGIDTTVGDPETVVFRVLDLSTENMHNQAWLITKLLETNTPSSGQVGRYTATQFLLQAFDCKLTPHPSLDLADLHTLLVSQSDVLSKRSLYTVHMVLLVVDAYLMSYPTTPQDKETLEALVLWARGMIYCYSDDAQCEILDRQIVLGQMKNIDIKLRCILEDYFGAEPRREVLFQEAGIPDRLAEDLSTVCIDTDDVFDQALGEPSDVCNIDVIHNQILDQLSPVESMEVVSGRISEDLSTVHDMDVISDQVVDELSTVGRKEVVSDCAPEDPSTVSLMEDVVSEHVTGEKENPAPLRDLVSAHATQK